MSLLIKGMAMPEKHITLNIFPNGYVAIQDATDSFIGETKAFPIPPHGRLIDANALEDEDPDVCNSFMRDGYVESYKWRYSHEQITNALTIIPAEEN